MCAHAIACKLVLVCSWCSRVLVHPQIGSPSEDELKSWGHHSDPRTVPDAVMQVGDCTTAGARRAS